MCPRFASFSFLNPFSSGGHGFSRYFNGRSYQGKGVQSQFKSLSLFSSNTNVVKPPITSQIGNQAPINPETDVVCDLETEPNNFLYLNYSTNKFINFLKKSLESFINEYIKEGLLVSDLITELLEHSNSGSDETVSTTKHILPLFESILTEEVMGLINECALNGVAINDLHQNIMEIVNWKFDEFFTALLNDVYKLQKDFVEEFNAKCNDELSASSKFSKDEVASFSLFMILDALSDTFRVQFRTIKSFIKTHVAVSYHSRLAEFQRRVIDYDIQRSLLAGGIINPSNFNSNL